jgi:hypothetical protein
VFAGQYRQLPAPPSGGVIKPDLMPIVEAIPAGVVEWCRAGTWAHLVMVTTPPAARWAGWPMAATSLPT